MTSVFVRDHRQARLAAPDKMSAWVHVDDLVAPAADLAELAAGLRP